MSVHCVCMTNVFLNIGGVWPPALSTVGVSTFECLGAIVRHSDNSASGRPTSVSSIVSMNSTRDTRRPLEVYSSRNACDGWIIAARIAGKKVAKTETPIRQTVAPVIDTASHRVMP